MEGATKERLRQGAAAIGVALDDGQVARLERYLALLLQWNRRINLTAITDPAEVIDRHFLDSLAAVPLLGGCRTLVDLGSGGGFPGAVLAIVLPDLQVTCVDSIHKKVAFLETLRMELAPNLTARRARDEELVAEGRQYEAAISRATWEPQAWLAHGAPLVLPGGLLLAMLSAEQPDPTAPSGFIPLPPRPYRIGAFSRRILAFRRSG